jgi:hypothetical protein
VDVEIDDDEEPYRNARAIDLDDDRPIAALSEEDMELIRFFFYPDHDPLVHEFSDLSRSSSAYAQGRDSEMLEPLEAGDSMKIKKDFLFKDLPTLRRWS